MALGEQVVAKETGIVTIELVALITTTLLAKVASDPSVVLAVHTVLPALTVVIAPMLRAEVKVTATFVVTVVLAVASMTKMGLIVVVLV